MTQEQQIIIRGLQAMVGGRTDVLKENLQLKEVVEKKDEMIKAYEKRDEEAEEYDMEIDCGIGKIDYIKPKNLQLEQLMEAFESAINKHGPGFVLQVLDTIS
jgi:uncharacterized NAD(P)/FAD-binding protein YdhS